jgi:hypothetical protein
MKRRILTILWPLLVGLPALLPQVSGQTVISSTTLTNAITPTTTHIVLGNNAGITAPGPNRSNLKNLMIDSEMFEAIAIDPPGTNFIHVTRGVRQSLRTTHAAGAKVWAGPTTAFVQSNPVGTCTRTALAYVPIISISTRQTFDCGVASGAWFRTDGPDTSYYGTAIASGASATVTPPAQTFKISGTSAITTIATPAGWAPGGCLNIIPTGNFTGAATTGNIGKAFTAVTGRVLKLCYGNAGLWYPSY